MKRLLGLFTVLAALASLATAQEDYSQWSSFKQYRVNTTASGVTTQLSANVLKFPLLVRLGQADSNVFKQAKTGGADIRFVKSDLSKRLPHQIERWDSTNRAAEIWVLLDTLYSNNNTRTTRLYWGNATAADSSNGTAVFDTALGDQAVWHMTGTAGTSNENDATANAFTATPFNGLNGNTTGAIGRSRSFTGGSTTGGSEGNASGTANSNEYFRVAGSNTGKLNFPNNGKYTISAWVFPSNTTSPGGVNGRVIVSKHDLQYSLNLANGGFPTASGYNNFRTAFGHATGPWAYQRATAAAAATVSQWTHIAAVRDTLTLRLYVNGTLVATNLGNADSNFTPGTDTTLASVTDSVVFIGRQGESNNRYFQGQMDEVRISNVVRNANYIRMSYETQRPTQVAVNALAAPVLVYTQTSASYEAGYAIPPVIPSFVSGFPALTYSVAPALPAGLTLNTATGIISGIPTTVTAAANYVITGTNSEGTALDTINIAVTAATEANYTAWTGSKTLNFSTIGIPTAQGLYPLAVRLSGQADSAVFAQAKAGGADLRFSRTSGTRLRYQIEHWDAVAKTALIWVQVDNAAANSATNDIRIHWGNAAANSQSSGSNVFNTQLGYQATWHMNAGGTGDESDATGNAFTATAGGAPTDTVGVLGRARKFNGTSQYFMVPNTASGALNLQLTHSYTLSAWAWLDTILPANSGNGLKMIEKGDNQYTLAVYNSTSPKYWEITTKGNGNTWNQTTSQAAGIQADTTRRSWRYVVGTFQGGPQGSALVQRLYFDGKLVQTSNLVHATNGNANRDTTYNVFLGTAAQTGPPNGATFARYWYGMLDELTITNNAQSGDLVRLNYRTQKPGVAPVSNLTYAAANYTAGTAITPNAPSVRGPATRFALSAPLPAGLSFNDTTGVISGTPTAPGSASVTVTAWSDSAWSTSATVNISVGIPAETYSQWAQHRDLYINTRLAGTTVPSGASVMSNVLKFPLLVRLDSANFAQGFTQSVGRGVDIRFTKPGDVVRLPHQVERWDSAGRKADIWVLVDTVKANLHTQLIRMHWGRAGAVNASSGSDVFGSANGFTAVWHLADSANQTDASGNGNTATASATAPTHNANSLIGAGKTFNGSTNWYQVGTDASAINLNTNTGPYTISAWVNPASGGCAVRIAAFAKYQNNNNAGVRQYALHTSAAFDWRMTNGAPALTGNGDAEFTADASGSCVEGNWSQIVGTYYSAGTPTADSAANTKIYLNGALAGSGVTSSITGTSLGTNSTTFIGRIASNERYMNGSLDEITVATALRDTSWIKLAYASQRPGANVVVHTTAPVSIGQAAARLDAQAFSVKSLNKGLLFQVLSEKAGTAQVSILDVKGRTVWSTATQTSAGMNNIAWNGLTSGGAPVSTGVYAVQVSLLDAEGKVSKVLNKTVPFAP